MGMRVCLRARVAVRVLMQLAEFDAADGRRCTTARAPSRWRDWLTDKSTLAVHGSVRDTPALTHSGFAALKVKDAVVDVLRDAFGARPDVDTKSPDVGIVAAHRGGAGRAVPGSRGRGAAPARLPRRDGRGAAEGDAGAPPCWRWAARARTCRSSIRWRARARWRSSTRWRRAASRPACAAASASSAGRRCRPRRSPTGAGCAPRPRRRAIAAQRDAAAAHRLRRHRPRRRRRRAARTPSAAGVDDAMTFERADVAALEPRWPAGTLVTNPPYGERLKPEALGALYRTMARALRAPGRLARRRAVGQPAVDARDAPQARRLAPAVERPARGPPALLRRAIAAPARSAGVATSTFPRSRADVRDRKAGMRPVAIRVGLSLLSAVLLFLAVPTFGLWPLMWVALVPQICGRAGRADAQARLPLRLADRHGRQRGRVLLDGRAARALRAHAADRGAADHRAAGRLPGAGVRAVLVGASGASTRGRSCRWSCSRRC